MASRRLIFVLNLVLARSGVSLLAHSEGISGETAVNVPLLAGATSSSSLPHSCSSLCLSSPFPRIHSKVAKWQGNSEQW